MKFMLRRPFRALIPEENNEDVNGFCDRQVRALGGPPDNEHRLRLRGQPDSTELVGCVQLASERAWPDSNRIDCCPWVKRRGPRSLPHRRGDVTQRNGDNHVAVARRGLQPSAVRHQRNLPRLDGAPRGNVYDRGQNASRRSPRCRRKSGDERRSEHDLGTQPRLLSATVHGGHWNRVSGRSEDPAVVADHIGPERYLRCRSINTTSEFCRTRSKTMCLPSGVISNRRTVPCWRRCVSCRFFREWKSRSQRSSDSGRGR